MTTQRILVAIVALLTAAVVVLVLDTTGVVTLKDESPKELTRFEAIATLQNSLRTSDWCYGLKYKHYGFGDDSSDQERSYIKLVTDEEDNSLREAGERTWQIILRAPEVSHLDNTARRGAFAVDADTGLVFGYTAPRSYATDCLK
jgi:hypothetical protein